MPHVPIGALAPTHETIVAMSAALSGGLPTGGIGAAVFWMRITARCANVALGSANDFVVRSAQVMSDIGAPFCGGFE